MDVTASIDRALNEALRPTRLEIINESHLHAGHAGSPGHGQSHFRVEIVSDSFAGESRLARQRMVYRALQRELDGPVHALSIVALTPAEATARDQG